MTTSAIHFLSKPTGRDPIDPATLAYMRQRNRGRVYSAVIDEFAKSGISQADLAGRLHKGTDQISRWLGSPGNWTLDTVSDLFFAVSGGEPAYGVQYPLDLIATNETRLDLTTPVPYYGAFPHDASYISGTLSYGGTANLNPRVTVTTPIGVDFQGGNSLQLAVPIGAVYLAAATSGGSNASVAQMGLGAHGSSTYYGGSQMGPTATVGGNLNVQCANFSGYSASVANKGLFTDLGFAHSGNEFPPSFSTTLTNARQAVMTPMYPIEAIVAVITPTYRFDDLFVTTTK